MQVSINGELKTLETGATIAALLESIGADAGQVAVERNGEIVSKSRYSEVVCAEGDSIELVRFIGGG